MENILRKQLFLFLEDTAVAKCPSAEAVAASSEPAVACVVAGGTNLSSVLFLHIPSEVTVF